MPTTKSAKKRLRQSLERRTRNRATRSELKTQFRKVHAAVKAADVELATTELRIASQKLDKAAGRNVIHANAAARAKSHLAAKVKSVAKPKKA